VIITKDKILLRGPKESGGKVLYKIDKVDPTKKPKQIDLTLVQEKGEGKPALGIYELEGDDLKLLIGDPAPSPRRPTAFDSELGIVLFVLKRDKK
jgi:uncharacterized protein (TIGR03067 family)